MESSKVDFRFLVRVSKPGYGDSSSDNGINIKAEHWMHTAQRWMPYNAFKLYLLFGSCNDREVRTFDNRFVHENLGLSLTDSYRTAFNELIEAGYVHRYGVWNKGGEMLYDFHLEPMTDSEYGSFVDNYYAE